MSGNFLNKSQVHQNPHATTDAVLKKIHRSGPTRPANLSKSTPPITETGKQPRGINMLRKAHQHPHGLSPHSHVEVDLDSIAASLHKRRPAALDYDYDLEDGRVIRKSLSAKFRKAFADGAPIASRGPQSSNAQWDNNARTDWGTDEPGSQPVTVIGSQTVRNSPSMPTQDSVDAIKRDLMKPKRLMHGGIKSRADRDDMDLDEDELRSKRKAGM